ncbi:MAG: hypothetical protein M3Q71_18650 [Chloroflexota bacterium]|nr:hypothetical protein [Chloroflexota bacterium]
MEDEHARQPADTTSDEDQHPDPPPPEDDAPLGWERLIPGRRVFRLSSSHPDFPTEWLAEYARRERERLEHDARTLHAVSRLQLLWAEVEPAMQAASTFEDYAKLYTELHNALEMETDSLPISDRATRRTYLAEHAFPERLTTLRETSTPGPFEIVVNNDTFPVAQILAPGEIMIRLSDTPTRHFARVFLTFVAEAQQAILGHKQRGRPADVGKAERVSVLRATGKLTARQIAELTGLSSGTANPDSIRKTVSRWQRKGDKPYEKLHGPAWKEEARRIWEKTRAKEDGTVGDIT